MALIIGLYVMQLYPTNYWFVCDVVAGLKKYICQKAVDSLATFVALKALCNGILKLMGSQVTTEIIWYKEV